jgi:hypothetical protein
MRINDMALMGADNSQTQTTEGFWSKLQAAAKGVTDTGLDTLSKISPIMQSYYSAEAARANARGRNLLPGSITQEGSGVGTPLMIGAGVGIALLVVMAVASKRR